jgi:phosphate transport system protein
MESQKSELALQELTSQLLSMGSDVESALVSVQDLTANYSDFSFDNVFVIEAKINERHLKVDDMIVELIAKYSPKASDLRRIFAISKMNADLERIGDQCRNCAFILKDVHGSGNNSYLKWNEINEMLSLVKHMVKLSLDGFSMLEISKMNHVLESDNQVDKIKNNILLNCKRLMVQNSGMIDVFLNVIMLAKNIERIGDHATNIAEEVIYACTGSDIRHGRIK